MKSKILSIILLVFAMPAGVLFAQPLKETSFDWVKYSRIFIIDGYFYPLCPLIEFDAEKLAETMVDMHVNVVRMGTAGTCGHLIPGTEFGLAAGLGNRDLLKECIDASKPRGIKVVAYMSTGHCLNADQVKPEWAQKMTPEGEISRTWLYGNEKSPVCWNTPYRQAFFDYLRLVVSKYDIDGIYFDAWNEGYFWTGHKRVCYCDGCKKGFKEYSGEDLPYHVNSGDYTADENKTIALYRQWLYKVLAEEVFTETRRIIKSYKDIPLIYNINNPARIQKQDPLILQGSDGFLYERGKSIIERAEGVSLATTHGLAVWPYVGTYHPFPRRPIFSYEFGQEIYTSVAFGGSPVLFHSYFFVEHPESREIVKEAFGVFDRNEAYINGFRPDNFCAVVYNDADLPGHDIKGYLWDTNARLSSLGSFYACLSGHIQTTSMLKPDLDNMDVLSRYKVLYLPDITYLTEVQEKNIRRFVENGGGLVMTYATSLFDKNGKKRNDFALGDIAGIRHHKPSESMVDKLAETHDLGSVMDMYIKTRGGQKVIKSPLADGLIPLHLFQTVDVLPGSEVAADIVSRTEDQPVFPGLIVSRYGKGKVAYIPSEMGTLFMQTNISEFADFIKQVIEYVSPENIPYEIKAPKSTLISNMMVKGDSRVIHLINWPGTQSERMWQNVYHIPPVEKVEVMFRIPEGKRIKSVRTFVPVKFSRKKQNDILYITLSKVEKYQGVVIEME